MENVQIKSKFLSKIIAFISNCFSPFLNVLASVGLLKGVLAILVSLSVVSAKSETYIVLDAISNSFFYFLPIVLSISIAKYLNLNTYICVSLASSLVYPNLVALMTAKKSIDFFGVKIMSTTYSTSVIPIMLALIVMYFLNKVISPIIPQTVAGIVTPALLLIIMVPLTLIVIGPLGNIVGTALSDFVMYIYHLSPLIAGICLGALWSVLTIFGLHWTFIPVMILNLSSLGFDPLSPIIAAATLGQAGACLAVFLRTTQKNEKSIAGAAATSAILGVTEAAVYGVNLKLKKPFLNGLIGGGIGGGFVAFFKVKSSAMNMPSILAIPTFIGKNGMLYGFIGIMIAFFIAFLLTYLGKETLDTVTVDSSPKATKETTNSTSEGKQK